MRSLYLIVLLSSICTFLNGCAYLPFDWSSEEDPYSHYRAPAYDPPPPQRGDIILGMGRHEVQNYWGEPSVIQSAGDPRSGNERWVYSDSISSRWSLGETRVIYFEKGQVVGWETESPYR